MLAATFFCRRLPLLPDPFAPLPTMHLLDVKIERATHIGSHVLIQECASRLEMTGRDVTGATGKF